MPSNFCVHFDNNPFGVFYPGQELSGTVELTTDKVKTISGINVTVNGYARTRWRDNAWFVEGSQRAKYSVPEVHTFTSYTQYICSRTYLQGKENGEPFELPAGSHFYWFRCLLPQNIPTTFFGKYGRINYEVVVTLDRPNTYNNIFRQEFTVVSLFDLNDFPSYKSPVDKEDESDLSCIPCCFFFDYCCESGEVKCRFNIPASGFVGGQKIPFYAFVMNESTEICQCYVELNLKVTYFCNEPIIDSLEENVFISNEDLGETQPYQNREFNSSLQIPSVPPSTVNVCNLIQLEYILSFVVKVGKKGSYSYNNCSLEIPVPLALGTEAVYKTDSRSLVNFEPISIPPCRRKEGEEEPEDMSSFGLPYYEEVLKSSNDQNENIHNTAYFIPLYPALRETALRYATVTTSTSSQSEGALQGTTFMPFNELPSSPVVQEQIGVAIGNNKGNYGWNLT